MTSNIITLYKTFNSDSHIGGFAADNWQIVMKTIICHELAHAMAPYDAHGFEWKRCYRILREEYINPFLDKTLKMSERKPEILSRDQQLYENHCSIFGMKKEWFNQFFGDGKENYKVVGWMPRARKYFVKVQRLKDDKSFIMEPKHVIQGFKLKDTEIWNPRV